MNKSRQFDLAEAKIQASFLLKNVRKKESEQSNIAAQRFHCLPECASMMLSEIKTYAKRKHALAVIALEHGYKSWNDLKSAIQQDQQPSFFVGGFLNKWFSSYADAKSQLQMLGGFLLPYKNQFFICDADYIKHIGFDANDPDWKLIGFDWVHPINKQAWDRLNAKWSAINATAKKIQQYTIKVTVMLERSFWVGIFERNDEEGYAVARTVFGGEPTDAELYEFVLTHYHELKFTEPQQVKLVIKRKNPKRMQREVRREMEKAKSDLPVTTFAQDVLRIDLEKKKKIKKVLSKAEKEQEEVKKFLLRQAKRKKKQKGR